MAILEGPLLSAGGLLVLIGAVIWLVSPLVGLADVGRRIGQGVAAVGGSALLLYLIVKGLVQILEH